MIRLKFYFRLFFGLPKSLLLNIKYFGVKGLVLPIIVTWNTKLKCIRGKVIIEAPLKFNMIRLGYAGVSVSTFHEWNLWNIEGTVIFKNIAEFGTGTKIYVSKMGKLYFGNNVLFTANSEIACNHQIYFDDNVLVSWNVLVMDTDAHPIRNKKNEIINKDKSIRIGKNVWIGARCNILKGTVIADDTIVSINSLTHRLYKSKNSIIAGTPAEVIMSNIIWNREHF